MFLICVNASAVLKYDFAQVACLSVRLNAVTINDLMSKDWIMKRIPGINTIATTFLLSAATSMACYAALGS